MSERIVTAQADDTRRKYWHYLNNARVPFDPQVFDEQFLKEQHMIEGVPSTGRGNALFFSYSGYPMVLRHYRRGGLIQNISKDQYIFTGRAKTRALRELEILLFLQDKQFPAPMPYACEVIRHGLFYQASLITHRLAGQPLGERLATTPTDDLVWSHVGDTIAQLHRNGVFHADLNANNILVDNDGQSALIDFDRACIRALPSGNPTSGWCLANIDRLEHSLNKLAMTYGAELQGADSARQLTEQINSGFFVLKQQWVRSLSVV